MQQAKVARNRAGKEALFVGKTPRAVRGENRFDPNYAPRNARPALPPTKPLPVLVSATRARASRARRFRANRQAGQRRRGERAVSGDDDDNAGGGGGGERGGMRLMIVEHDGSSGNLHGKGSPRDAGRPDREGTDARHYRELVADRNRRQLQQRVLQNMF